MVSRSKSRPRLSIPSLRTISRWGHSRRHRQRYELRRGVEVVHGDVGVVLVEEMSVRIGLRRRAFAATVGRREEVHWHEVCKGRGSSISKVEVKEQKK